MKFWNRNYTMIMIRQIISLFANNILHFSLSLAIALLLMVLSIIEALYTPCVQASNPVLQDPDNLETPISRNRSEMINPKPTNLRSQ